MLKVPIWKAVHHDLCEGVNDPSNDDAKRRLITAMRDGVGAIVPLLDALDRVSAMRCVELMFALVLTHAKDESVQKVINTLGDSAVIMRRDLLDMCADDVEGNDAA